VDRLWTTRHIMTLVDNLLIYPQNIHKLPTFFFVNRMTIRKLYKEIEGFRIVIHTDPHSLLLLLFIYQ